MERIFVHSNKPLKERRRKLRKNQTPEEKMLWKFLRKEFLGVKFQRQHSIGPYIVDFYCARKKLVIELDGSQHSETESKLYDKDRTKYFNDQDMNVIRFWNSEINHDVTKAIETIKKSL